MAQVLPPPKVAYCKVRSVVMAEECHIPFERGWVFEPRGLRSGEVVEPDLLSEITSFFIDNPVDIPVADNIVICVWAANWLIYLAISLAVAYYVSRKCVTTVA